MNDLTPLALKDAPALIETVFPAQKVSIEAQEERNAGAGQTLTSLGSFWKGRKPLILVRSIILGILLPPTGSPERDLEIFEKLMAFDDHGLARRALAKSRASSKNSLKPSDLASRVTIANPWDYFTFAGQKDIQDDHPLLSETCPFDARNLGISLRWRRDVDEVEKLALFERYIGDLGSYEEKANFCKRPEEIDEGWLYEPVWPLVNRHYASLGINAHSFRELVAQFGALRYGQRPRVGDTFSGGGSIPFEAARLGCDVLATDLNPIACALTWGALNIIGADDARQEEIKNAKDSVFKKVEAELEQHGVETDDEGNVAKAFLYCLETECPETGWKVPLSVSWVISKSRNIIAKLIPDPLRKRFEIAIVDGASDVEMIDASYGTVQDGSLVYKVDSRKIRIPLKTLRGDFRSPNGVTVNKLRRWDKDDFEPRADDVFQERLYAIQWIKRDTLHKHRQATFFREVTSADIVRERQVSDIVRKNIVAWQLDGLISDMHIEGGDKTDEPIRTRGWTHWHHLFTARQLLFFAIFLKHARKTDPAIFLLVTKALDRATKLCRWNPGSRGRPGMAPTAEKVEQVFDNQAFNTQYNYAAKGSYELLQYLDRYDRRSVELNSSFKIQTIPASELQEVAQIYITDPPYANSVMYHEITEFFIAWLRRDPPSPFDEWIWDSRRVLAIKGTGDDFRRGMVDAYRAMAEHMPDNGMQCVMFTHQDTGVWSDMVGIFWAAGLQVVAAWYIATETTSELKKGGYVQGTVILMLRKRPAGERSGFKQRILPAVRTEVERQIESMMHLNDEVKDKLGEPVFNDSDLQMAGYAAALKVLTAYTHIGGDDVTSFALRPRQRGEETVVDEIVQQAAEAANSLLVPEGLEAETWSRLTGIQRFYFRMMDMETTGASKLDNYQNFAKAFRVSDYGKVMGNMAANSARLKRVTEFASRDLTDSTEIGPTWLGRLIIGLQQLLVETEPTVVVGQIQEDLPDFLEIRRQLIDMLSFIERKAPEKEVRDAAEVLGGRLKNLRAFSQ